MTDEPYRVAQIICPACGRVTEDRVELASVQMDKRCFRRLMDLARTSPYTWRNFLKRLINWFVLGLAFAFGVGVITLVAYPLYKSIMADNVITHCYIEVVDKKFVLQGYKRWNLTDAKLGDYKNIEEALDAAAKLGCKVK